VAAAFAAAPWMVGIQEVWADIRRAGERSVLITMSPDFFARLLLGRGVDEVHASGFRALPFRTQPDPALILTPRDKGQDRDTRARCLAVDQPQGGRRTSVVEQPLTAAQHDRVDPELAGLDEVVVQQRLRELATALDQQVPTGLLLELGYRLGDLSGE
jgi:hypothetical protein